MMNRSLPVQKLTGMASLKSSSGQSELLVSILLIILASSVVLAYNVTNITNGTDFLTGHLLNESLNTTPNPLTKSIESSATIQVWARTSLILELEDLADSWLLKATLSLDNGSAVEEQEIFFWKDDVLMASNFTGPDGLSLLHVYNLTSSCKAKAYFYGSDSLRHDSSSDTADILVEPAETAPDKEWVSYDPVEDIITVVSDGLHCTREGPCSLSDIYDADQQNGWNRIENIYNYFSFQTGLMIGDGTNETHLHSTLEHIYTTRPWVVMPGSTLQFGNITDGNQTHGGVLFESNVSEGDQLGGAAAIRVEPGGTLHIYGSSYKVYSSAENNIRLEDGCSFEASNFDMQRIDRAEGRTRLFIPAESRVDDLIEREYIPVECADIGSCENIREESL
jgi:hypothetical protein